MDFIEAMQCVKQGKKITRPSWPPGDYGAMEEGHLRLRRENIFYDWIVHESDVFATDWSLFPILFAKFEPKRGVDDHGPQIPH